MARDLGVLLRQAEPGLGKPALPECHFMVPCVAACVWSQSVSHVLLRGLSRAAIAATSFDVPALLAVLQQTGEGVYLSLLPAFLGGNKASLRQLFRPDGFFAYADDRQAQVRRAWLLRSHSVIVHHDSGCLAAMCGIHRAVLRNVSIQQPAIRTFQ